jgi:hypothetical protein
MDPDIYCVFTIGAVTTYYFFGYSLSFSAFFLLGTKFAQCNSFIGTVGISIPFPQRDEHMYNPINFKLTYGNCVINLLILSDIM